MYVDDFPSMGFPPSSLVTCHSPLLSRILFHPASSSFLLSFLIISLFHTPHTDVFHLCTCHMISLHNARTVFRPCLGNSRIAVSSYSVERKRQAPHQRIMACVRIMASVGRVKREGRRTLWKFEEYLFSEIFRPKKYLHP
jgi:hypothetical protein